MTAGFRLSDDAQAMIEPLLPKNQPGARRVGDRRVIGGSEEERKSMSNRFPDEPRSAGGVPLAGLPGRSWPAHDDLQPLQLLEPPRSVDTPLRRPAGASGVAQGS